MKSKKSQLQMMENAFIILIVFVILIIAFLFVIGMQRSGHSDKITEFNQLELIKKAKVLNFLPEMQCSDNNNIDPDCYDILKIESFIQLLQNDKDYEVLLGHLNLSVKQYDLVNDVWTNEWYIYDKPREEFNGVMQIQFPISLYDRIEDEYYFGVVYLGIYE